ncbi:MAG: alpha/beta hydrolase [Planctomycetes bacterium]|nr:alpha/beta hydrolase [Planctomycetota bacterium]
MVTKGQLLERPVVIPGGEWCLDGIYLRGQAPGLLLASPLPGSGGSMANPLTNELAYAAAHAGRASLRMDYRGVAGSEGQPSDDLDAAVADLRLGLDFLLESTGAPRAAIAGVSTGCWAALAAAVADPRIDRVLLVAPPRRQGPPPGTPDYAALGRPLLVVVGELDPAADPAAELSLTAGGAHGRLKVLPGATAGLREALTDLAHLVAPFLGAERRHTDEDPRPRGKLF